MEEGGFLGSVANASLHSVVPACCRHRIMTGKTNGCRIFPKFSVVRYAQMEAEGVSSTFNRPLHHIQAQIAHLEATSLATSVMTIHSLILS